MSATLWPYLVVLVAGTLMTEPWRWAGLFLSRNLDVESEVFKLARAVSTAIVSALVARLVVLPTGALADIDLWVRIGAFLGGIAVFLATGWRLLPGVGAGVALLLIGAWLVG
ncbi:MAG: AzlD domain-containing protein [Hyphomicrobiaceae bacterium]